MLPSPAPKYYLVGTFLSLVGTLLLALRGRRRDKDAPRPWIPLIAGGLSLALGVVVIANGISVDQQYNAGLNTTTFSYRVSLEMNGSWPVRILIPAPADARFDDAMNATNGSATLRLSRTAADAYVVVTAQGNVTFEIQTQTPTAAVSPVFTRLSSCGTVGPDYGCNATVEVGGMPPGMKVHLALWASIGVSCDSHSLILESWIGEGVADYRASVPNTVC